MLRARIPPISRRLLTRPPLSTSSLYRFPPHHTALLHPAFSRPVSTTEKIKDKAESAVSSVKSTYKEMKGEAKGKAAELKGELKGKIAKKKGQIQGGIEAIDASLRESAVQADESVAEAARPGHDLNFTPHALNSGRPSPNRTPRRGFSSRSKQHAGDIRPGEMVESSATENRNIPTTDHPHANEESAERFRYKQSVDSYERDHVGVNHADLADEARAGISTLKTKARAVMDEARERSYDLKDSMPSLDTEGISESVKERTAHLAEKAKSTLAKAKDYTMGAFDTLKEKVEDAAPVGQVSSKIRNSKDSLKQKLGDAMDATLTNTAAPDKRVIEELEQQARYGAGRNFDEERLEDDSINPADINLSDSAYEHDHNINIDVQRPESIPTGADTNMPLPNMPHDSSNLSADSNLNEINDFANEERLQTGNKNIGSNTTSRTMKNKDKYPHF